MKVHTQHDSNYRQCLGCKSYYHTEKGGKYFCNNCKEEVKCMARKVKFGLIALLVVTLLATFMWFRGGLIAKCWYSGFSLEKQTETLLLSGQCKINRGTEAKPDWVLLQQLRGFGDSE